MRALPAVSVALLALLAGEPARPPAATAQQQPAYLPALALGWSGVLLHPDPALAERVWRAAQALDDAFPLESLFPAYEVEAPDDAVQLLPLAAWNLDAACHDFPDLPEVYGEGVHHRTCTFAVASYLGNYHAVAAARTGAAAHIGWAQAYLHLALLEASAYLEGPETAAPGGGYRDTMAAAWQNPLRAVDLIVLAEQLRRLGALDDWTRAHVADTAGGIARAWQAAFWQTGVHPSHGVTLTIRTPPQVSARSPFLGLDVACRVPWAIAWDADGRNTPAEEAAWMGAGVMLTARAIGDALPDGRELAEAGRHYVDYALSYDREDPLHGVLVRTLSRGDSPGPYGARRLWLKNHAADAPAIPYLAATWHFIGTALFASPLGSQRPWPGLVPDDQQWSVMRAATEATLTGPDGANLVDWSVGGSIGYLLEPFPLWRTECGTSGDGRAYTRLFDRRTGTHLDLSEIGHPAGLDLLAAGWVVRRMAAAQGDAATYRTWTHRLDRILEEYTARPPDPAWARCKFAPYVSDNPAYHLARYLSAYTISYLGLNGFEVEPWAVDVADLAVATPTSHN